MPNLTRRQLLRLAATGAPAGLAGLQTVRSSDGGQGADAARSTTSNAYRVLTCDGGGIRGLVTARVIQRLQEDLLRATDARARKLNVLEHVQCFAGTSTGGLIALGLGCKIQPARLAECYSKRAKQIFRAFEASDQEAVERAVLRGLKGIMRPTEALTAKGLADKAENLLFVRYDSDGLRTVLEEMFKEAGDPETLSLESIAKQSAVIVTTMRLGTSGTAWQPFILHNLDTRDLQVKIGRATRVIDAGLCTSAAPVFFPPHKHPEIGHCVDGGLFANNPGMASLTTIVKSGVRLENIRMLSIGTGSTVNWMKVPPFHYTKEAHCTRLGVMAWLSPVRSGSTPAFPLLAAILESSSLIDEHHCQNLLSTDRYRRIQIPLAKGVELDASDDESLEQLEVQVQKYIASPQWQDDLQWVIKNYLA